MTLLSIIDRNACIYTDFVSWP